MKSKGKRTGTMKGTVTQVTLSGMGPNSGQLQFSVTASNGRKETFIANVGGQYSPDGHIPEVFAGFVSMSISAYMSGKDISVNYVTVDPKQAPRVSAISLPAT